MMKIQKMEKSKNPNFQKSKNRESGGGVSKDLRASPLIIILNFSSSRNSQGGLVKTSKGVVVTTPTARPIRRSMSIKQGRIHKTCSCRGFACGVILPVRINPYKGTNKHLSAISDTCAKKVHHTHSPIRA